MTAAAIFLSEPQLLADALRRALAPMRSASMTNDAARPQRLESTLGKRAVRVGCPRAAGDVVGLQAFIGQPLRLPSAGG
jgi:hypothetical protein